MRGGEILRRMVLGALLGAALACGPHTGEAPTVTPGTAEERPGPEAAGPHEGESGAELAARLEKLRVRQQSLVPTASDDPGVCEDVCSLATSICGVKEKLCNIANEHPQDEPYQRLCREAKAECREAQDTCVACVEKHAPKK